MIVRILNEGQWRLDADALTDLNQLDDAVEAAVGSADETELASALHALLQEVRTTGEALADDELVDSDLILPAADSTIDEVRDLLSTSADGLIPG